MILYLEASVGFSSTFILPTRTLPLALEANSSMMGVTEPQVGHQGAQANNNTGKGDFNTLTSKLLSVTMTGCGSNSSSVLSKAPHLPHLPPASTLPAGILFLAPHSEQRILTASPGASYPLVCRQEGMTFPAFGGHAGFFSRYSVSRSASRATNNIVTHQTSPMLNFTAKNLLYDKDSYTQVKVDCRFRILDFGLRI